MERLREDTKRRQDRARRLRHVDVRERHAFILGSRRKRCIGIVELRKYLVSRKMTPRKASRATRNVSALRGTEVVTLVLRRRTETGTSGRAVGCVTLVDAKF